MIISQLFSEKIIIDKWIPMHYYCITKALILRYGNVNTHLSVEAPITPRAAELRLKAFPNPHVGKDKATTKGCHKSP